MGAVNVEECCCGCTLRTGTLILLWAALLRDGLAVLTQLSFVGGEYFKDESMSPLTFQLLHWGSIGVSVIGIVISVLGIYAIQKNQPQFLIANILYFCFLVIGCIFNFLLLFIDRYLYYHFGNFGEFLHVITNGLDHFPSVLVAAHFFLIVISAYFTLVIKCFRDTMIGEKNDGGAISEPVNPTSSRYAKID